MATDMRRSAPGPVAPPEGRVGESMAGGEVVAPTDVLRLGSSASALAFLLTVLFIVATVVVELLDLTVMEAATIGALRIWTLVPVLALAPVVVVAMACLYRITPPQAGAQGMAAVALAVVYAAVVSVNYMIQLVVMLPRIDASVLPLLSMGTPSSVFTALEATGYGFLSLMALAAASSLDRDGSVRALRWALVATGTSGVIGAAGAVAAQSAIMLGGFGLALVAFLVATVLLTRHFRSHRLTTPPRRRAGHTARA